MESTKGDPVTLDDLAGRTRLQRAQRAGFVSFFQFNGYLQANSDEMKTLFAYMTVALFVISADNFLLHVRAEKAKDE
jgi:hypothetical protein